VSPVYLIEFPGSASHGLNSHFHHRFPMQDVCPAYNIQELILLSPEKMRDYSFFCGQFFHGIERLLKRPVRYCTILRDPVERYLAGYLEISRTTEHPLHCYASSLEVFLQNRFVQELTRNIQTRTLASSLPAFLRHANVTGCPYLLLSQLEHCYPLPPEGRLQMAMERLAEFDFVGIEELPEQSVELLNRTLRNSGAKALLRRTPTLNRALHSLTGTLTPKQCAVIRELNEEDFALYEYGKRLLCQAGLRR
jgi:hypothetical protein